MIPGDCAVLREDAGVVLHSQTWRKGPPNPGLTVAAPRARPSWPGRLLRGEAQSWSVTRAPALSPPSPGSRPATLLKGSEVCVRCRALCTARACADAQDQDAVRQLLGAPMCRARGAPSTPPREDTGMGAVGGRAPQNSQTFQSQQMPQFWVKL